MRRRMKIPLLISRWILGGVFVYASFDKILHPYEFAEVVYNYQILPDALVNLTAILLPWLELSAGVFLILGLFVRGALFTCNGLLAVFLVALAFNFARGLDIDCGCFSSSGGPSTGGSMILYLLRDAFLLAMGLFIFFHVLRRENPEAFTEKGAQETSM
jgi:cobalt-zinc-cadmium efflux system protein